MASILARSFSGDHTSLSMESFGTSKSLTGSAWINSIFTYFSSFILRDSSESLLYLITFCSIMGLAGVFGSLHGLRSSLRFGLAACCFLAATICFRSSTGFCRTYCSEYLTTSANLRPFYNCESLFCIYVLTTLPPCMFLLTACTILRE